MEAWSIGRFLLVSLAVWRVTHLLAEEDGPADAVVRLRERLGDSIAGRAMDCFYCLSLWIAAPFAMLLASDVLTWALGWLALSGAACLLQRATERRPTAEPYVVKGNESHVVLRSKEAGVAQSRRSDGAPAFTADDPGPDAHHVPRRIDIPR
jgi:hypothetical protein